MNKSESTFVTRTSSRLFQFLPGLFVLLIFLVSASVWAQSSSVIFDDFDGENQNSEFRVDQQCKTPRPDLEDTNGIADWEQWCYVITSLQDTSCCPGEFTHFGVVVDASQHMDDSAVKSTIQSSMTVSPNNSDYHPKDFRTSGGSLWGELQAQHVRWNNHDDNLLNQGESALFCFAAPAIASSTAKVALKVGSIRDSATLQASGDESIATFEVNKNFSDDNPMEVEVQISCDNGLPLKQSQVIREGKGLTFVVKTFDTNQPMNCRVWETEAPGGYSASYDASVSGTATTEGCFFNNISSCGFAGVCNIDNDLEAVEVEVTKEWTFKSLVDIDEAAKVEIFCENFRKTNDGPLENDSIHVVLDESNPSKSVFPYPNYSTPVSRCRAVEKVVDSAVESDGGCTEWMTFGPGDSGVACTITNTVFFEGIPTLNRYGLAIMALLMLGLGVLGFRRFV